MGNGSSLPSVSSAQPGPPVELDLAKRAVSINWLTNFVAHVGPRWTSHDIAKRIVVPSTSDDISYAHLLDNEDVGLADAFISYSWEAPFHDVVAMIMDFCAAHRSCEVIKPTADEEIKYVWIDLFAVNQHKPSEDLDNLDRVIERTRATLVCVHNKSVASRTWCLYEWWRTSISLGWDFEDLQRDRNAPYPWMEGRSSCSQDMTGFLVFPYSYRPPKDSSAWQKRGRVGHLHFLYKNTKTYHEMYRDYIATVRDPSALQLLSSSQTTVPTDREHIIQQVERVMQPQEFDRIVQSALNASFTTAYVHDYMNRPWWWRSWWGRALRWGWGWLSSRRRREILLNLVLRRNAATGKPSPEQRDLRGESPQTNGITGIEYILADMDAKRHILPPPTMQGIRVGGRIISPYAIYQSIRRAAGWSV